MAGDLASSATGGLVAGMCVVILAMCGGDYNVWPIVGPGELGGGNAPVSGVQHEPYEHSMGARPIQGAGSR